MHPAILLISCQKTCRFRVLVKLHSPKDANDKDIAHIGYGILRGRGRNGGRRTCGYSLTQECGQTTLNNCAPKHYITPINVMP